MPLSVAVADFNADGKVDLATGNYLSNNVSVLLNLGVQAPPPPPKTVHCVVPNVREGSFGREQEDQGCSLPGRKGAAGVLQDRREEARRLTEAEAQDELSAAR